MGVYYAYNAEDSESLEHFGIIGMKWGVRRFQNPDGTLTPEGRERYYGSKETKKLAGLINDADIHAGQMSLKFNAAVRLMNTPQLKNVAARVHDRHRLIREKEKEVDKIEDSFYKRKDFTDWVRKAAKKEWDEHGKEYEGWTFERLLEWYLYDDGDQGDNSSFNLWLKTSNDPQAKRYKQLSKESVELRKEVFSETEHMIKDFLGDYRDAGITYTNALWKTQNTLEYATKASYYVDRILNSWDTYEDDFPAGSVPIEDLMHLTI